MYGSIVVPLYSPKTTTVVTTFYEDSQFVRVLAYDDLQISHRRSLKLNFKIKVSPTGT